jgi:predicted RNase H-like HicB family nuclease
MRYLAYLQQDEDGVFVATCPSLPGCVSQGATRSEAQANIREAIELYLQRLQKHGEPIPPGIEEEVIQVHSEPPHRRLSVPNHKELAKGTLRTLIRDAGLTVQEFVDLL